MASDITPFTIHVPDEKLDHLRRKLELTTFPNELEDAEWSQGAPLSDIRQLHSYWLNGFDWRKQEEHLNSELPQFQTPISVEGFGELKIHFVHAKSETENAIPLLFCHGWPGSFIEVLKILPGLIKGGADVPAFHIVAPSLPGYGFSEGPRKKGFSPRHCGQMCHKLMLKLGYQKYVTQGGDWGTFVTRSMGFQYPEACLASHLNLFVPNIPMPHTAPLLFLRTFLWPWSKAEKDGVARATWYNKEDSSYFQQHASRPQTIGYSQTDSPVGLLAWIYEKLHAWTDDYGWLGKPDEVLTWISIYWHSTAGPVGGMRLYYEYEHDKHDSTKFYRGYWPHTKLGMSRFPQEILPLPMKWNSMLGPVVFENTHSKGGHFAAWEAPHSIVGDLQTMFGRTGGAFKVIPGKSGFDDTPGRAQSHL